MTKQPNKIRQPLIDLSVEMTKILHDTHSGDELQELIIAATDLSTYQIKHLLLSTLPPARVYQKDKAILSLDFITGYNTARNYIKDRLEQL